MVDIKRAGGLTSLEDKYNAKQNAGVRKPKQFEKSSEILSVPGIKSASGLKGLRFPLSLISAHENAILLHTWKGFRIQHDCRVFESFKIEYGYRKEHSYSQVAKNEGCNI